MASLPYPRCRPRGCSCLCCTNRTSGEEAPTECTEYTEPLAEKELPQMARMRTDVGGYGIPAIPTLTNSVDSVNSVGEKIFPQNARNAQKLLAEKSLPQMSTELTEPLAEKSLPQISTDVHRYRRVWHPCHTHATKFCEFCGFRGNKAHPKHLCKSVKSVGGSSLQEVL